MFSVCKHYPWGHDCKISQCAQPCTSKVENVETVQIYLKLAQNEMEICTLLYLYSHSYVRFGM